MPVRLCLATAALAFLLGTSGAPAEPVARVVTRIDTPIADTIPIAVEAKTDTALNRSLAKDFRDALEVIGRLAGDGAENAVTLIFDAETVGERTASDATIGSVVGDAEGRLDFELKLWSSGGGSSLFQGPKSAEKITTGHRLNALLLREDTVHWQGFILADTSAGDAAATLGSLVQTLIDRLQISVDETIPLR